MERFCVSYCYSVVTTCHVQGNLRKSSLCLRVQRSRVSRHGSRNRKLRALILSCKTMQREVAWRASSQCHPQWYSSCSKAIPPKSLRRAPPTWDQVFKRPGLWKTFPIQTSPASLLARIFTQVAEEKLLPWYPHTSALFWLSLWKKLLLFQCLISSYLTSMRLKPWIIAPHGSCN